MFNFRSKKQYPLPLPLRQQWWKIRYPVQHESCYRNLFHCTVHKAGSQWIVAILGDTTTHRYSGRPQVTGEDYVSGNHLMQREVVKTIPRHTIVSPLYIGYSVYNNFLKQENTCAIFVQRDPRDLVVSRYFSLRYSHVVVDQISQKRQQLDTLPIHEGLCQTIDWMETNGAFAALRSWKDASLTDSSFLFLTFEEMIGENGRAEWKRLLEFFDIQMPDAVLTELLQKHSFEAKSGRKPGEENKQAHYRKGVHGDWKNHFDEHVTQYFKEITGDLVVRLHYEQDMNWEHRT
jgi:hypothetical protein